jgi:hypothetical protein
LAVRLSQKGLGPEGSGDPGSVARSAPALFQELNELRGERVMARRPRGAWAPSRFASERGGWRLPEPQLAGPQHQVSFGPQPPVVALGLLPIIEMPDGHRRSYQGVIGLVEA